MVALIASVTYLLLYVPFGIFFTGDGLPSPYAQILGGLILFASPIVGHLVGRLWAVLLPMVPWAVAVVLIYAAPDEGEVGREGAAILWSFLFAFLTALVLGGAIGRRRGERPPYIWNR